MMVILVKEATKVAVKGVGIDFTLPYINAMPGKLQHSSQQKILRQEGRIDKLKKLLTYYKEITETIREPFIILDQNLHVVTANLAFYRKFKVAKKDTENKRIYELGNSQWDAPELRELLENILPRHGVLRNYEVTHNFPKLGTRTMLLNARQVDSKQLILMALEDITTRKQLKVDSDELTANLVKQRNKLQHLNDAKDEFVSLASHQLRTPTTVVKQYVAMLSQGFAGKVSNAQRKMLNTVHENNERQLEIIEGLLRVAKVDAGKVYLERASCDIVRQMEQVIKGQDLLFKLREQTVVFNKPRHPITVVIDSKLISMVLENVLDNAGKYSPPGSTITINIAHTPTEIMVAIKDNGIGIRKKDLSKLFKKFSRIESPVSSVVKGTGLGLYWAKKIINLHGGSIKVASKIHQGSTFTIIIPGVNQQAPARKSPTKPATKQSPRNQSSKSSHPAKPDASKP